METFDRLCSSIKPSVKWEDTVSKPFAELLGILRRGSSSADKYKHRKNNFLEQLHGSSETRVGHLHL